jgi:hypothetical protein
MDVGKVPVKEKAGKLHHERSYNSIFPFITASANAR